MESQDQRSKSDRPFSTKSQVIDSERNALVRIGFQLRPPPPPHTLTSFITPDSQLFQTIRMGCAVVEPSRWTLVIDGLVQNTIMLSLSQLQRLPYTTVTSFHECYGSPLKPPVANVMRVGNVVWKGVRLRDVLKLAQPLSSASFVWSEGLDHGTFGGRYADRYQKDLPLEKAMSEEVLLAWEINGEPLSKERGGPVRLVVPGWFGTNSTKWVCKLSLKDRRAESIYTTVFYNEIDPTSSEGSLRPVWQVEPNSIIVEPKDGSYLSNRKVVIKGWAWSFDSISTVQIRIDSSNAWLDAVMDARKDFSWQKFSLEVELTKGMHQLLACATSQGGLQQPITGRRNHCHSVNVEAAEEQSQRGCSIVL